VLKRPFAEQVAFFRGKLGNLVPTQRWTDMLREQHDRAFMVAGAQSADLLAGLAAAVDRAITEGKSIDAFRKDFAALVEKSGWDYTGGFDWRTRTIYRTNLITSYAAGRQAQLRDGKFPYRMYKHGDPQTPRLQHERWDGLVLPADHPFWIRHSAPNGWGCTCRTIGLRSPEDARRLGGDPSKALPDDWDAVDPKTGAPVGIDKGWDYTPGDTVSDTVAQMAAKAQQWDDALAKAYMQGVPDSQRDALATAYRSLPSVADDARLYAQKILEGRTHLDIPPHRTLGLTTSDQASAIREALGINVASFDWSLDQRAVKELGNAQADTATGQRAITPRDYVRLPQLLNGVDGLSIESGLVHVEKVFGEERHVAVFAPLSNRRTLALKSLTVYRESSKRPTPGKP
jgi:hypothetical protein